MGELAHAMGLFRGKLPTVILRWQNLKEGTAGYSLAGSVPNALTVESNHGTPQWPPLRVSMSWDIEQEAIDALLSVGVTRFQLADCSWYNG